MINVYANRINPIHSAVNTRNIYYANVFLNASANIICGP